MSFAIRSHQVTSSAAIPSGSLIGWRKNLADTCEFRILSPEDEVSVQRGFELRVIFSGGLFVGGSYENCPCNGQWRTLPLKTLGVVVVATFKK